MSIQGKPLGPGAGKIVGGGVGRSSLDMKRIVPSPSQEVPGARTDHGAPPAVGAGPDGTNAISRVPIDKPTRHRGNVHIIEIRCKECEFCVTFCPQEVLQISSHYTAKGYRPVQVKPGKQDDCIACRFCEDVCPEYAIYVEEAK